MTESNNDRFIGELKGRLDALIENQRVDAENARVSRQRMYDQLLKIESDVAEGRNEASHTRERMDAIEGRLVAIEPVAKKVERWEVRITTVVGAATVVGAGLSAIVTTFKDAIMARFGMGS